MNEPFVIGILLGPGLFFGFILWLLGQEPPRGEPRLPSAAMRFDVRDKEAAKGRNRIEQKLDTIIALLTQNVAQGEQQMADLSALQAEVEENGEVGASAVALLNGLSQQLRDAVASNDPAAVQALADQLDAQTQALADAVSANTSEGEGGGVSPGPGETPA